MKQYDESDIDRLPGRRIGPTDRFRFKCHAGLSCFNQCCRNLNLFLYPYDVLTLKNTVGIASGDFLDRYVDVVLRKENYFPEVLLRMADNSEKTCPFLTDAGCSVYTGRPDTCRSFPVEQGLVIQSHGNALQRVHFFRPPDFCLGASEETTWTVADWDADQEAERHHEMTARWAAIKHRFQQNPWGSEGPSGSRAKMTFMATYNIDAFRTFVLNSSFLKRYKVKPALIRKIRQDDAALLKLGFSWVQLFLWGKKSNHIFQIKR
ncbi:MAG: YkgJ family cysteine cluster protein [Deltaproteobacteria bacterium]|nr:YkgJ family cysteine cluster protein [Deltaproteobacteria bacterium]